MDGVATVRVYSANPKTADGYNTVIFRREIEKSLRKLMWSPVINMSNCSLPENVLRHDGELVYDQETKEAVRAFVVNEEVCRKNGVRFFEYGIQRVRLNEGLYLALGEVGVKANSRPYYDQRIVAKFKADSEAPSLHGHLHIGESAFEQVYDNRFRLILQGVELYCQKMVKYAV